MTTLKGIVEKTNYKYIWHSSGGCEKCNALEGKEFDTLGEIPERPHPNCKCEIERVKIDEPTSAGQEDKKEEKFEARDKFIEALHKIVAAKKLYDRLTFSRINKTIIDLGNTAPLPVKFPLPATSSFWDMASHNFRYSQEFIKNNGKLYENIEDLTRDQNLKRFENTIRRKVKSQFIVSDTKGVYFHEKSTVSKAISNSKAYENYLKQNMDKIKNGELLTDRSLEFEWYKDSDLYAAFHYADILETKLSVDRKSIETYILDTYDFNKDGKFPPVVMARSAQETEMLTPYYTITKVVTPI